MARTTPFKKKEDFEHDLKDFANKYRTIISNHSEKISDYFEISCYNMIIKYYQHRGYKLEVCNKRDGKFRYKCSPNGHLNNFSYFSATKSKEDGTDVKFYIFHNATVQSVHDPKVFTSPDIVVADVCTSYYTDEYYETKKKLSYLANGNVITFCEAKNFVPFPELMINFVGMVNELKPKCLSEIGYEDCNLEDHIAPSMMMSGSESKPCKTIRISLENRYWINFFDNLFDNPLLGDSSVRNIKNITTLCKKGVHKDYELQEQ